MNFYHHQQRLVAVFQKDFWVKEYGGRREVFSIDEDEQLIGCELDEMEFLGGKFFSGITWLKMKVE